MAAEDGDQQYATLDRAALAGIDQHKLIKTIRVEDDGTLKTNAKILESALPDGASTSDNQTNGNQISKVRMATGDATFQIPRLNPQTHAQNTIDYAHHEIHSGSHFFVQINKDVPNGETYNLAFTTPNTTKWLHMLCSIDVELEAEIILYEGITSFTGGTGITPYNSDRNSATASGVTDMAFDVTPTLGTPTILCTKVLGSGKTFGGGDRSDHEIILKQNTKYYILVTNQATGASNEVNIDLEYYEHTNRTA